MRRRVETPGANLRFIDPAGVLEDIHRGFHSDEVTSVRVRLEQIGPFDVEVEVEGFETVTIPRVALRVEDEVRVTAKLRRKE